MILNANQYTKTSKLNLTVQKGESRDFIKDVSFTSPFKITKPFYDEEEHMSIMMVSVSAGIMQGDNQEIEVNILDNASATIYSQSYEKIHKMRDGSAKRYTKITVNQGGELIYSPLPTIPFADSAFQTNTDIYLADTTAKLRYSEILSCGRAGRGERFAYRYYKALTKVYVSGNLVYMENAKYLPSETDLEKTCMFEGFSHLSNMILVNQNIGDEQLAEIRKIIEDESSVEGGASFTYTGDVCVRILANSSEILLKLQQQIYSIL